MVYLHFPSNLTEEELMLQAKYQKLKKKVVMIETLGIVELVTIFMFILSLRAWF